MVVVYTYGMVQGYRVVAFRAWLGAGGDAGVLWDGGNGLDVDGVDHVRNFNLGFG